MYILEIKIHEKKTMFPFIEKGNEMVKQKMATDDVEALIERLISISNYLRRQHGRGK